MKFIPITCTVKPDTIKKVTTISLIQYLLGSAEFHGKSQGCGSTSSRVVESASPRVVESISLGAAVSASPRTVESASHKIVESAVSGS